jgi:uncharacterized membrane protein
MRVSSLLMPAQAKRRRSVVKSISWRVLGSIDTFVIGYLITGNATWAGSIAGLEVLTKMVLYYLHERVWAHIGWGVVRG